MGHVDHGKTTLLDKIRHANVVAGEAGGITQHIGAYKVRIGDGDEVTFIDTPGHAAFTKMRARGAQVTDIVVLVVAADDGVMPQTIEAINHAKAAEVPIVVARQQDRQGQRRSAARAAAARRAGAGARVVGRRHDRRRDVGISRTSASTSCSTSCSSSPSSRSSPPTRPGGPRASCSRPTSTPGRGPVATVLVDKGTLKVGDPIVAGGAWGRVRAMIDDKGEQVKEAGPSTPVQVLGLSVACRSAGDEFRAAPDEKTARTVGEAREQRLPPRRPSAATPASRRASSSRTSSARSRPARSPR